MYFWEDICVPVLIIVGFIAGVIFAIATAVKIAASAECSNYAQLTGAKTYFTWTTGCLVQGADQKWLDLHAVTKNDVTVHQK
jgi:hypothetical protein